jgi:hypothetical protein
VHRYKGAPAVAAPRYFGAGAKCRRVAQPGRALRSGRRGRRFESSLSDHFFKDFALIYWTPISPPGLRVANGVAMVSEDTGLEIL